MSIRLKFTIFVFFLVTLIILAISYIVFLSQSNFLRSQYEENRQKLFKDIVYTCNEAVIVKDEILIINTLKSFLETYRPFVVYTIYVSPLDIKLVFVRDKGYENEFLGRVFSVKQQNIEKFVSNKNEIITEFSSPLKNKDGSYAGTIKVGFSQTYLNNQIENSIKIVAQKILNISLVSIFLSLIFVNLLVFFLVKPIKVLTKAALDVSSGNLEVTTGIKGNDELGILGRTFDEMVQKVRKLDELKDSFVSSVSHELRSPLSAIDGYVDYLIEGLKKDNLNKEKQNKALMIIKDSVRRLTEFINNILDLAKIKAGKFELFKTSVKVEDIILEIVSLFDQLAKKQNKKLKVVIQENLPAVYADPEKLKQVITNLLGNALKFTDASATITINARLVTEKVLVKGYKTPIENTYKNYVEISVSDTGYGIPEDEIDKVFDKFYQVGSTYSKKPTGTGLGLSIAAEIVKFHNGAIGVESKVGQGSTFKFIIPVFKT